MAPERKKDMRAQVGEDLQEINPGATIPGITMPATMIASAANNYMWISSSNTSARESCWPSFFLRPDGIVTGRLRLNTAGVLITKVDTEEQLYDSTVAWRNRAMDGIYHSGRLVKDKWPDERTKL